MFKISGGGLKKTHSIVNRELWGKECKPMMPFPLQRAEILDPSQENQGRRSTFSAGGFFVWLF